jgi:small-conductance mechanosensitive channel
MGGRHATDRRTFGKVRTHGLRLGLALFIVPGVLLHAQQLPPASNSPQASAAMEVTPPEEAATLTFNNRPITVLRAQALGRPPAERAAIAARILHELVSNLRTEPVAVVPLEGNRVFSVGGRTVFALTPLDVDDPSPDALDAEANRAVAALRQALAEAREAHTPRLIIRAIALSLVALAVALAMLVLIARVRRRCARQLMSVTERQLSRASKGSQEFLRASHIIDFWRGLISLVFVVFGLVVCYFAVTFILRQFPYTRPWGESMRSFMLDRIADIALAIVAAVPALFTVLVIALVARFINRLIRYLFNAIEQGSITVHWIHPDTAQQTRRLITLMVWVFALVMAYPYLPGSETDAFKGASVFVGLVLSLGSSGFVNQILSSFMITYSRALHLEDFVRVGEIEGTVTHLGILSTKLRTLRGEEVTIPNANVVSQTMTNYSVTQGIEGVYASTKVTIGYDTPWRQVQALLLMAAGRTSSVRQSPAPAVRQTSLADFYVEYTLFVCPERPALRAAMMSALHANILDAFNEYGVQIMSPNYEADPDTPKLVPRDRWHDAPAQSGSKENPRPPASEGDAQSSEPARMRSM